MHQWHDSWLTPATIISILIGLIQCTGVGAGVLPFCILWVMRFSRDMSKIIGHSVRHIPVGSFYFLILLLYPDSRGLFCLLFNKRTSFVNTIHTDGAPGPSHSVSYSWSLTFDVKVLRGGGASFFYSHHQFWVRATRGGPIHDRNFWWSFWTSEPNRFGATPRP